MNMEFKEREEEEKSKNKQPKRKDVNQRRCPYGSHENSFKLKGVLFVIPLNNQFPHQNPLPMICQTFLTNPNILGLCQLQEVLVVLLIIGKLCCALTTLQHESCPLTGSCSGRTHHHPFFLLLVCLLLSQSIKANFIYTHDFEITAICFKLFAF